MEVEDAAVVAEALPGSGDAGDNDDAEEESDSDDSVNITLGTMERAPPASAGRPIRAPGDTPASAAASAAAAPVAAIGDAIAPKPVIDLDARPTIQGVDVYEFQIDSMATKPWLEPGADISDFFNYGFNEHTWRLYSAKQKAVRDEFGDSGASMQQAGGPGSSMPAASQKIAVFGGGMSSSLGFNPSMPPPPLPTGGMGGPRPPYGMWGSAPLHHAASGMRVPVPQWPGPPPGHFYHPGDPAMMHAMHPPPLLPPQGVEDGGDLEASGRNNRDDSRRREDSTGGSTRRDADESSSQRRDRDDSRRGDRDRDDSRRDTRDRDRDRERDRDRDREDSSRKVDRRDADRDDRRRRRDDEADDPDDHRSKRR